MPGATNFDTWAISVSTACLSFNELSSLDGGHEMEFTILFSSAQQIFTRYSAKCVCIFMLVIRSIFNDYLKIAFKLCCKLTLWFFAVH